MGRRKFNDAKERGDYCYRMARLGMPFGMIARVLDIDHEVLKRDYGEHLEDGKAEAAEKVLETLFDLATRGDPSTQASTFFYCKTQLGMKEVHGVEVTGEGGGPVRVIQAEPMSQEEWERYYGDKSEE